MLGKLLKWTSNETYLILFTTKDMEFVMLKKSIYNKLYHFREMSKKNKKKTERGNIKFKVQVFK